MEIERFQDKLNFVSSLALCFQMVMGSDEEHSDGKKPVSVYTNLIFAGVSGMLAMCFTQSANLLKARIQAANSGTSLGITSVVSGIINQDGYRWLYKGLSAILLKQCMYSTGTVGVFHCLHDFHYIQYGEMPSFYNMILMGMCGGAVGSFIAYPADVALIRMTADGRQTPEKSRNYKNVFNALSRIAKEEGLLSIWRGCSSSIIRAILVNGSQLSTYAQTRNVLKPVIGDCVLQRFLSGGLSVTITILISLPIDNINNLIKTAKKQESPTNFCIHTFRTEGFSCLWRGMLPTYLKTAPQSIITFVLFEHMRKMYRDHIFRNLPKED